MPTPRHPSPPLKKNTCPCVVVKKNCRSPRQVSVTKSASKESSLNSETKSSKRLWSRMLCKFLVITCNLVKPWPTSFVASDNGSSATSSANNPWAHAHREPYSRDASNSAIPAFISSDTMPSLFAHWIEPSASTVATLWNRFCPRTRTWNHV